MAYWLFKSEPGTWSWDQQKARGKAGEEWSGVRNYQARNNMRAMKKGEQGFFYHSGSGKEIVGIVEVSAAAHPDSTDKSGQWACVDIRAVRDLPKPVSILAIKAEPRLKNMALVKNSRLSVQPVNADEWRTVCEMGGIISTRK
ncbi:MAG TPA: EVE domain-containing protein [Aestuariivirgaceae bacterium]|jgi:predicted RNA-binding protein with PUA-like domain